MSMKNVEVSRRYRLKGNEFYVKKRDEDALRQYFKALDTAPPESADFYHAVSNAGCALMRLGFYEDAIKRLQSAVDHADLLDKSESKINMLREKIVQCSTSVLKKSIHISTPPHQILFGGANMLCPQLSSKVAPAYDASRGRHLVAIDDIPAGSVILMEKPTVKINVQPETHCLYCCHRLPLSYIPCTSCFARFCNETCRRLADRFHHIECARHSQMRSLGIVEMAARVLLQFDRTEIEESLRDKIDRSDVSSLINSSSFRSILLLEYNNNIDLGDHINEMVRILAPELAIEEEYSGMSLSDIFKYLFNVITAVSCRAVNNAHTIYKEPAGMLWHEKTLPGLLLDASGLGWEDNSLRIEYLLNTYDVPLSSTVATCLLPVASVLNHSCLPNVFSSFTDVDSNCLVLRTSRDIKTGEEILHNYGPACGSMEYANRQAELFEIYGFHCHCDACVLKGFHPIDLVLTSRRCLTCQADFLPDGTTYQCEKCSREKHIDESSVANLYELPSLEMDDRENILPQDAYCKLVELQNFYQVGNLSLERFAISQSVAAIRRSAFSAEFEIAKKFVKYVSDSRRARSATESIFVANALFAVAVVDYVHMSRSPHQETMKRLKSVKENIQSARCIFHLIYGERSLVDEDLDRVLSLATALVQNKEDI
ncbi:hypothetical protein AB6A40_000315 [Gnathostoma spinigerum]|uniref:SET domain-containing protein n=1 Tax=Gnathostoma spinigerum TaxID=75299 RepID=A0ABD6E3V9_9BILA